MENIDVLDRIKTWPLPKSSPVDIKIENINWEWLWQFNNWVICNKSTIYDEKGWRDYLKDKEDEKRSLMSKPAPHIFDVINYWPQKYRQCLGTKDSPEGWMWQWMGDDWVLSNGTIDLKREDWFKYKFGDGTPVTSFGAVEDSDIPTPVTAASMLQAALGHMEDRAKNYDAPGGERSMGKTVSAFNTITGLKLSEEQGWIFMEILKQVRSQQGNYRADNYEDMVAYAALRGECAARERKD